jgi:FMN phosphatase YigB (HAD superfamily)
MRIAIGFDFDHTLALDNRLERTALIDLAHDLGVGIAQTDVARLAQIDTLLQEMRLDKLTLEQMVARFVHSLHKDHTSAGLVDRFREICFALVPSHVTALPGASQMLEGLEERAVPHAVLTNGWSPLQEKKAAQIGYDGPLLVSAVIGASKPSPQAFGELAAVFPAGARIWYVGDNPATDIRGSIDVGFEGIWYHEHAGVSYPSHLPPPSAIIDRLLDVLAIVDDADAQGRPGRLETAPKM